MGWDAGTVKIRTRSGKQFLIRDYIKMVSADFDSVKKIRSNCLAHARQLLTASQTVFKEKLFNISYHLCALALEEIGKGEMIWVGHGHPIPKKGEKFLKVLEEDHAKKLFWALWGPSTEKDISPEEMRFCIDLSNTIHSLRLKGLYVDLSPDSVDPSTIISEKQVENLIGITEARLNLAECYVLQEPSKEGKAAFDWLLTTTDDPEKRNLLYGEKSMEKLKEMKNVEKWVVWLKEQFDEADKETKKILQDELNKKEPSEEEKMEDKWKVRYKLLTPSHAIEEKNLKEWNDRIHHQKFKMGKKEGSLSTLIVEFLLPKGIHIKSLWLASWSEARRHTIALNIATHGFFWWYMPKDVSRFYEKIIDLENESEVRVERTPRLIINWGGEELNWEHLQSAVMVYRFMPRGNEQFLNEYTGGISLMGKSDIHTPFEQEIFLQFYNALVHSIEFYKDRQPESPIEENIEKIFSVLIPGSTLPREYSLLGKQLMTMQEKKKVTLKECGGMKIFFDVYLMSKIVELAKQDEIMSKLIALDKLQEDKIS